MEEWVNGLSIILRGDLREKAFFTFSIYDLNDDGIISRDEVFQLLSFSLVNSADNEDSDDMVRDLVDYAFKRLDVNHDGRIDFDDFFRAVSDEFLFLELLAPCLPTEATAKAFLATLEQPQYRTIKKN